jgi:hypothetical protein
VNRFPYISLHQSKVMPMEQKDLLNVSSIVDRTKEKVQNKTKSKIPSSSNNETEAAEVNTQSGLSRTEDHSN